MKFGRINKIILIFLALLLSIFSSAQVKDTLQVGEYAISTLGNNVYVNKIDVPTIITSKYGALVADTVFYVPATAPNDTIYTLMTAANNTGRAAILFQRGSERDTVITVSNDSLLFASYSSGVKPKVYGSEVVTGWTLHSGNIYKATVDVTDIKQLFLDGDRMLLARYPNSGYFDITSITNTTTFVSTDLDGGIDYTGASWIGRTSQYTIFAKTVTSSSSTTLVLESAPSYSLGAIISGLSINTYHFRVVAVNSVDTTFSTDQTITLQSTSTLNAKSIVWYDFEETSGTVGQIISELPLLPKYALALFCENDSKFQHIKLPIFKSFHSSSLALTDVGGVKEPASEIAYRLSTTS